MKTRRKRILAFMVVSISLLYFPVFDLLALVDSSLTEQTGGNDANLERNSSYRVICRVAPQVATVISGIDTSCKRRSDTFENVTLSDRISYIPGMITWETSKVNKDYDEEEGWVTAQYVKANTVGDDWSALAQNYVLYYLNFRVKRDAPTGASNINYTLDATISGTGGSNEKGTFSDFNYIVIYDKTPPVTTPDPAAGYYNTDIEVAISADETPSTVYYSVGVDADYAEYTAPIAISGAEGTCTETDLWMKSVDVPYQSSQNWEIAHYAAYVIDKEDPSMSNFSAVPEVVGMGGTVTVGFDVSDCSGVLSNNGRPNYVLLGGKAMSWASGEDAGRFEYQRAIDGTEENPPVVEVKVTDRAGNWTIQTVAGLVEFDLDGPEFAITPLPDPVYLEQLLEIDLEASETLSAAKPTVTVGGLAADYDSDEGDRKNYDYVYLMTGRNWEASFSFLSPSEDWDEDELPNWWETRFGLDPHDPTGPNGLAGDPDEDGWTNLQEYQFYEMAGELSDPTDPASGGQAIPLHKGWNLISYTVNTAWYTGEIAPSGLLTGVSKVRIEGDSWGNFFSSARFKGSAANMTAAQVRHPNGEWKYYGQFQPDWRNTLDYISPDQGLWINMAAADTLILRGASSAAGKRITPSGDNYPAISLGSGWNLVGILPRTCFYTEGYDHDAAGPSDLAESRGYSDVATTLKAAFNLNSTEFNKIRAIQIMYSNGVKAYDSTVPARYWSLKFVQPGAGVWIRLNEGQTTTINYREP